MAIEDSRWGIESAKAAGLWCIGITHTYPVAELLEADAIVTSLAELTPDSDSERWPSCQLSAVRQILLEPIPAAGF